MYHCDYSEYRKDENKNKQNVKYTRIMPNNEFMINKSA